MQELVLTETDLSFMTGEIVESFRDVIESSGRQFSVQISPALRGKVEKQSYQQLVSILMDNAAKYCDEKGIISVQLDSRGKGVSLTVSNTYAEGQNVDYSRFFERFYRKDVSHNSAIEGFGIGLSMGKEIAERLGGKIKVIYADTIISFVIEL